MVEKSRRSGDVGVDGGMGRDGGTALWLFVFLWPLPWLRPRAGDLGVTEVCKEGLWTEPMELDRVKREEEVVRIMYG